MKKNALVLLCGALLSFGMLRVSHGADDSRQPVEFATIRWGGREYTHIVRPGGRVEFVGDQLSRLNKPDHADDRAFYMNAVVNALAKEGYEFAGMSSDDIIMKRPVR
jgi:hypothetical protein